MKKIALCLLLPLLFYSCQTARNLAHNISKPTLSVADVRVTDFSFNELELTYDVKVNNPNPVPLHMLSYDYNFKVNGHEFVQGDHDKQLRIAESGSSTFQIPMRINFQDLYSLFGSLRSKDQADYQFLAHLAFNLPVLGKTTLPLKKDGTLPMIKLPKIELSSIKLNHLGFSEAKMAMNLKVHNPNGFGLLLKGLTYHLNVNKNNWVDANKEKQVTIQKNNSQIISIPISLNLSQIGTSVIQLLHHSDKLHFHLNGDLKLGTTQPLLQGLNTIFHFNNEGKVPLIQ